MSQRGYSSSCAKKPVIVRVLVLDIVVIEKPKPDRIVIAKRRFRDNPEYYLAALTKSLCNSNT